MMNINNAMNTFNIGEDCILTVDDLHHSEFPKPKEFIELTEQLSDTLFKVLPDGQYSADFLIGDTIPMADIEMRCGNFTAQIMPYTQEEIFSQLNTEIAEYFFIGGEIKIKAFSTINGEKREITTYSPLIITKEMKIGVKGSFIQIPKMLEMAHPASLEHLGEVLSGMREIAIATWVGIQLALLNPVIRERTKLETVPNDPKGSKHTKKGPKKYIKRVTIGDISDMLFDNEKKTRHITEPFWWVTGHWREYRRTGKKVFIKGYWKGPFRQFGHSEEPRERQIVVE